MNNKNSIILLLAIIGTLTSCFKERIDINNNKDENKKLVIIGWINSLDEPQFVQISNTVNYLGGFVPDGVSGAMVTLEDETNVYTMEEKEKGNYYLPGDWKAKVGDTYQLSVSYDGKEYTASHHI